MHKWPHLKFLSPQQTLKIEKKLDVKVVYRQQQTENAYAYIIFIKKF